jgi:hypothetical protein
MPDSKPGDVAEARAYIGLFRRHIMPGTKWVETDERRIRLDDMTDDDALFVAGEFKRMEAEAARRDLSQRRTH